jgi:hypothetical protein
MIVSIESLPKAERKRVKESLSASTSPVFIRGLFPELPSLTTCARMATDRDLSHMTPILTPSESAQVPTTWCPVIQCCGFLLTLVFTCLVVNSFMPFWHAPDVYPKWQYFADHRDQFDTLFVGSSLIRHHVIPPQFDAEMAGAGMPEKSFNFGCSGMWPPESYYVVRSILKLRPAHLRWVFIDAIDMNTRATGQEVTTLRSVHWHDAVHTWFAFRAILESKRPIADQARTLWAHGFAFGIRTINSGRGAEWLSAKFLSSPTVEPQRDWASVSGFEPLPDRGLSGTVLAHFEESLKATKEQHPMHIIRPGLATAVLSIADELRRANVEPIFIMPPSMNSTGVQGWPAGVTLLSFNDPDGYAQLYDPALRYDMGHLNAEGAQVFTRLLAQKFLQWRKSHPSGK